MAKRVLVTGAEIDESWLGRLAEQGLTIDIETRALPRREIFERLDGASYYLYGGIEEADLLDAEEFKVLADHGLRLIAFAGKGVTDFLRVPDARQSGIIVTNTPGAVEPSVAEFTVMLMLSLLRSTLSRELAWLSSVDQGYPEVALTAELGRDLSASNIGIIGLGDIGLMVARILRTAYGASVKYYSRTRRPAAEAELGVEFCEARDLITWSSLISIHLANTDGARDFVAKIPFEDAVNSPTFVVNTASQSLIPPDRVAALLSTGAWAAAAFDKIYKPDDLSASRLLTNIPDRLVVTNHAANATLDAWKRMTDLAIDAIVTFDAGGPTPNVVDGE